MFFSSYKPPSNSLLTVPRRWFWCGSLLPVFFLSEFGWCFTVCLFIILFVRFGLLSDHLLGIAAHSVSHLFSLYFVWLWFWLFPIWFWGRDLPSDCSSSCSLLSYYFFRMMAYIKYWKIEEFCIIFILFIIISSEQLYGSETHLLQVPI